MESVFLENDWKRHMSINLDTGLWQDFKSGEKGNFITLYAYVENLTYQKAQVKLLIKSFDAIKLEEDYTLSATKEINNENLGELTMISIDNEPKTELEKRAWNYLVSRAILTDINSKKYFISNNPRFAGRVIIPFEKDGFMYYFQARTLTDQKPKYLNPTYYNNLKVSDVLYPFDEDAEYVVICEGPIDAISLQIQGVNATSTQGCSVSYNQLETLRDFKGRVILAYDNDAAGLHGQERFDTIRKNLRMPDLWICPVPKGHKDWNSAHCKFVDLHDWVEKNSTKFDYFHKIQEMIKYIG